MRLNAYLLAPGVTNWALESYDGSTIAHFGKNFELPLTESVTDLVESALMR